MHKIILFLMTMGLAASVWGQERAGGGSTPGKTILVSSGGNIATAVAGATSGMTIHVYPGNYTNNNLLKAGVNYFFEPGVTIYWTATDPAINGWGIFDDRPTGPTTNYIYGFPNLVYSTGTLSNGTTVDAGFVLDGVVGQTHASNSIAGIVYTNLASEFHLQLGKQQFQTFFPNCWAMYLQNSNGKGDIYYQDLRDLNEASHAPFAAPFTSIQFPGTPSYFIPIPAGIYWELGDPHIHCIHHGYMGTDASAYGVWCHDPSAAGTTVDNFTFNCDFMEGRVYVDTSSTNYRTWWTITDLVYPGDGGQHGAYTFFGGFNYILGAQKIKSTGFYAISQTVSNGITWVNSGKISSNKGWLNTGADTGNGVGSIKVVNEPEYADDGGIDGGFLFAGSRENEIRGSAKVLNGRGMIITGGTNHFYGLTINTANTTAAGNHAVDLLGTSSSYFANCTLISSTSANSIHSTNAQTTVGWGTVGNTAKGASVTYTIVNPTAALGDANVK